MKFGTFQGVFTPTMLTILGVIMYLRGPWVVGNAGVLGAIGIITLASVITLFTSLSMSSIVTNIRIKAGGAFSIISQSLGLEAGGAIGIPLYIAQAFAVAMYIFGFREGWLWIFPEHPALLVDLGIFLLIFLIANISTDVAFKIQYLVLAIIFLSLVSIGMGFLNHPLQTEVRWLGHFEGAPESGFQRVSFWVVFAVYFPAVTGIMAGANMSGDLKDPRRSIPSGTLLAVGLSYLVYVVLAVVAAFLATPQELLENYNVLIDKSFFAPAVIAGLLGATFSSALSSLVGAPRILQAMGQNNILFWNEKLARTNRRGEPKFAFYFTVILVMLALLLRDLNAIAPLLTMFFLITYAMINVVVLVEQGLGQISFRPSIKIPMVVPLLGAIGCFMVMFIINSTVGLISIGLVLAMYIYLSKRKNLETEEGDTRSGMFNSLAEWSAKVVSKLPEARERSWQPNLLVPAQTVNDVVRCYKSLYNLSRPKGSVKILGFDTGNKVWANKMRDRLPGLVDYFMEQHISAASAMVEAENFRAGVLTCMQGLKASFFTPNTLFLSLTDEIDRDEDMKILMEKARQYGFGSYLYMPFRKVGLGLEKTVNLWLDLRVIDLEVKSKIDYINLSLLTAYLLKRNWKGRLNFVAICPAGIPEEKARAFLDKLITLARLPHVDYFLVSDNPENLESGIPHADLNLFSLLPGQVDLAAIRHRIDALETSCLFTMDGGAENAFA
ncbi:MAG: Na-K-Cl cotransporter [Lewinellaceae bacterium]|nr:Na-K-Cl cotransporter [Lewinellaceae bacterium]